MTFEITRNWKTQPMKWKGWRPMAAEYVRVVGTIGEEAMRREAPVYHGFSDRVPGKLRDSITPVPTITNNAAGVSFIATVPYAKYVIDGAPPHIIVPRKARVLRWRGAGGYMYASRVNHPGQRKNDFPRRALLPLEPVFMNYYQRLLAENLTIEK